MKDDPAPKMLIALVVVVFIMLVATGVIDLQRIGVVCRQIYTSAESFLFPKNWNL